MDIPPGNLAVMLFGNMLVYYMWLKELSEGKILSVDSDKPSQMEG
jgi:hypothetical protein